MIGPNTGPRKTLAVNRLIAGPRPAADQMSAITPPQFVIGTAAKNPEINLVIRRVSIFWASDCPRKEAVYSINVYRKMGLRPMSSLPGPHINGYSEK
jgi:hypothetical protein